MPFPTPFLVIRSPIHIRSTLPPVIPAIRAMTGRGVNEVRYPERPNPMVMAVAWTRDNTTAVIRVYFSSFFRPSSPSFLNSSSFGTAIANSWMMMDAVI